LIEWLRKQGEATVRQLYKSGPRAFRGKQDEAQRALDDLVERGLARCVTQPPRGGRPPSNFYIPAESIGPGKTQRSPSENGYHTT